jgi:hypothetical protein
MIQVIIGFMVEMNKYELNTFECVVKCIWSLSAVSKGFQSSLSPRRYCTGGA